MTNVALTTRQETKYQGNDWWHWSVWIDGSPAELDAVRCVTYLLHSTFPNPERVINDRASKFRLDSAGWGGFKMQLIVEREDGSTQKLTHDLDLEYPDEPERDAPTRGLAAPPRVRVFLSHSAVDIRTAVALQDALTRNGIEILDPHDVRPGEAYENAISQKVKSADVMVALLSDTSGRTIHNDIQMALKNRTRVVVVELGASSIPIPPEVPRIPLANERDVAHIIDSLVHTIRLPKK